MKKSILTLILLATTVFTYSQNRTCAYEETVQKMIANDPSYAQKREQIKQHALEYASSNPSGVRAVVTIPVVVHVVYNTTQQNISDAQIQSQIDVINADFRRLNSDANNNWPQAADAEFEFCLASIDPQGNPTTGITRTQTNQTSFSVNNDNVKLTSQGGKDNWAPSKYLNIWVCNLSGGLLGYATPPGGFPSYDGVVIGYDNFGKMGTATFPFHLGRTGTHEIGHWLNLEHIWGNGCNVDDGIADTPNAGSAHYGCPNNPSSCGSLDMSENYMDYVDDNCMNLFTAGQKAAMQALFSNGGARASILNSNGCGNGGNNGGNGGGVAGSGTCNDPYLITCGVQYSGSTVGFPSTLGSYSCQTWDESGPEAFLSFTISQTENVTVALSNITGGDLDVGILSACSGAACIALGDNTVTANLSPGTYKIVVDGYQGASGNFSILVTCNSAITPTSIQELNANPDALLVYPNPVKDILNLDLDNVKQASKIHVMDLSGKRLISKNIGTDVNFETIDMSSLAKGTYILQVETAQGLISKKVSKN